MEQDKLEILKKCVVCKEHKPLSAFSKSKREKDGLSRDCKICNKNRAHEWYLTHKERAKEIRQKSYAKNKELYLGYSANWAKANREKCRESHLKWKENHPEKARSVRINYENKRRAWENNCENKVTTQQINDLIDSSNNICFWCDEDIPKGQMHIDHIYPLSKGGKNDIYNLVVSCCTCNKRKADKDPEKFLEEIFIDK